MVVAVFAGLHCIPAGRLVDSPAGDSGTQLKAPARIGAMLARGCGNCHASQAGLPWYGRLAPISWLVGDSPGKARRAFQFSVSTDGEVMVLKGVRNPPASLERRRAPAATALANACAVVDGSPLPHQSRRLLHPQAELSHEEIRAFCYWTRHESRRLLAAAPESAYRFARNSFRLSEDDAH